MHGKDCETAMSKAKKKSAGPAKWANRIIGHAEVPASEITAHPSNFRFHPDTQRAAVSEAISRLGWIESVIVNKTTGRLLNGHLRVELAAARNEVVPVSYVELTEQQEKLALASIDPLGGMAVEDPEKLAELLAQIDLGSSALDTFLSTEGQDAALARLFNDLPDEEKVSEGPRLPHIGTNITVVIASGDDLGDFEKAIHMTGEMNRAKAIMEICRSYINAQTEFQLA